MFSALIEMSLFTFSLWCIKLISFILCHQGLVAVTGQQINKFLSSLDNLIVLCIKFICLWPILCQSSRKVLMMTLVLRLYLPPMVLWIYIYIRTQDQQSLCTYYKWNHSIKTVKWTIAVVKDCCSMSLDLAMMFFFTFFLFVILEMICAFFIR